METIKEFFTDSEWDLIYSLVDGNRQFCDDEEELEQSFESKLNSNFDF